MKKMFTLLLLICFVSSASAQFIKLFPGDLNNDGSSNHIDLIPLLIAYDSIGPNRSSININWELDSVFKWGDTLPVSQLDIGRLDGNGDGRIDSLDLDAVFNNYDSIQTAANPQPYIIDDTIWAVNPPHLYMVFNKDTADINDTFEIEIYCSGGNEQYEIARALAFTLEYNGSLVKDSLTIAYTDTFQIGNLGVAATSQGKVLDRLPSSGNIDIAFGNKYQPLFGLNKVAVCRFIVEDDIMRAPIYETFEIDFKDVWMINEKEQQIYFTKETGSIVLRDLTTDLQEIPKEAISVQPNPAFNHLSINLFELKDAEIKLYDIQGRLVLETGPKNGNVELNVQHLDIGLYLLEVISGGRSWKEKIVVKK